MALQVQSDKFHQLKPHQQHQIEQKIEKSGKFAPFYSPSQNALLPIAPDDLAYYHISLTNIEVLELLKKAIKIVSDTEQYISYQLENTFGENKTKWSQIPPGTIRIYSQDLICFYNGHSWRKLKP